MGSKFNVSSNSSGGLLLFNMAPRFPMPARPANLLTRLALTTGLRLGDEDEVFEVVEEVVNEVVGAAATDEVVFEVVVESVTDSATGEVVLEVVTVLVTDTGTKSDSAFSVIGLRGLKERKEGKSELYSRIYDTILERKMNI